MRRPYRWWEVWLHGLLGAWRMVLLATVSVVLVWVVSVFYLVPATETLAKAGPEQQKAIRAMSALLLAILLTLLVAGVVWAARRRR